MVIKIKQKALATPGTSLVVNKGMFANTEMCRVPSSLYIFVVK